MNVRGPETEPELLALQAAIRDAADRDDAAGMAAGCLAHAAAAERFGLMNESVHGATGESRNQASFVTNVNELRDHVLFTIAQTLMASGQLSEAHETTLFIRNDETYSKSYLLAAIAEGYAAIGHRTEARDIFLEALNATRKISSEDSRRRFIREIVTRGQIVDAFKELHLPDGIAYSTDANSSPIAQLSLSIPSAWDERLHQIGRESSVEATATHIKCAEDFASLIANPGSKGEAFVELARRLIEIGFTEGVTRVLSSALNATRKMPQKDARQQTFHLSDIACLYAEAGRDSLAKEICTEAAYTGYQIDDPMWRGGVLAKIVLTQCILGQAKNALHTATLIESAPMKVRALVEGVRAATRVGRQFSLASLVEPMVALAVQVQDEEFVVSSLSLVAQVIAYAGWIDDAIRISRMITHRRAVHIPPIVGEIAHREKVQATGSSNLRFIGFKQMLIPCAYYFLSTYRICGTLAHLYPDQGLQVAATVAGA